MLHRGLAALGAGGGLQDDLRVSAAGDAVGEVGEGPVDREGEALGLVHGREQRGDLAGLQLEERVREVVQARLGGASVLLGDRHGAGRGLRGRSLRSVGAHRREQELLAAQLEEALRGRGEDREAAHPGPRVPRVEQGHPAAVPCDGTIFGTPAAASAGVRRRAEASRRFNMVRAAHGGAR